MNRKIAYWPFDEGEGCYTFDPVNGISDYIHYVFNTAKYKPVTDPIWSDGIKGKALLFDGYSTWIERGSQNIQQPKERLSVQAWMFPRSFGKGEEGRLCAVVSNKNLTKKQGFALGVGKHGILSFQIGTGEYWFDLRSDNILVSPNKWSYIAAVFDGSNGSMSIYINGLLAASMRIPANSKICPCCDRLFIGRDSEALRINDVFYANMYNGLIDELIIEETVLNREEILNNYEKYSAKINNPQCNESILFSKLYKDDIHRPQYHFIAPEHWMNEPHAPLFFKGQYHIFFQHNPLGPFFYNIHWGHAVSPDMVHWRYLPFALSPERNDLDPDGDWSGCSIIDDEGMPVLVFTAGNDSKNPNQMIAIARSMFPHDGDIELKNWIKDKQPIATQKEGIGWFGQFRDPFVWKEDNTWYMLVGSGIEGKGGTALAYSSQDLVNWEYRNDFYVGDYKKYPKTGQVWELPVFLRLGKNSKREEKYILLVNPWFSEPSEHYCKYVWYWVGTWDKEKVVFIPDDDEPQLLDIGEHFTGPSGFIDPSGRCIIFSITQDRRTELQHFDSGWAHNAGLPVTVFLRDDDKIGIRPIDELKSLRAKKLISLKNVMLDEAEQIRNIQGDMLEIQIEMISDSMEKYGVVVRSTENGSEQTLIYFDPVTTELCADRTLSSMDPDAEKNIVSGKLEISGEALRMHIFIDRSMIEVYANELKALTTRAYPTSPDATHIKLLGNPNVKISKLDIWQLRSAYDGNLNA
jgi:sucrose-6-phosphate hydrolase SacC (GH32 family)